MSVRDFGSAEDRARLFQEACASAKEQEQDLTTARWVWEVIEEVIPYLQITDPKEKKQLKNDVFTADDPWHAFKHAYHGSALRYTEVYTLGFLGDLDLMFTTKWLDQGFGKTFASQLAKVGDKSPTALIVRLKNARKLSRYWVLSSRIRRRDTTFPRIVIPVEGSVRHIELSPLNLFLEES